jgi:hypothetical protein
MADFAEGISDTTAGRRLARAIQGRGAFRPTCPEAPVHGNNRHTSGDPLARSALAAARR